MTPSFLGVGRVERVFRVDKGAGAALLLGLGQHMQRQRRLARAFRSVNLDNPPFGQAADAESDVEAERSRGDRFNLDGLFLLAELHDRALTEIPLDLGQGCVQRFLFVHDVLFDEAQG